MLWLFFISAISALVAQGQLDSCTLKYYTVNTYEDRNSFTFSCYGIEADCNVYYSPPGTGCNGESLILLDTVAENATKVLTLDGDGFQLGGGFCSNNQIDVSAVGTSGDPKVHLPKATEAGTRFHIPVSSKTSSEQPECLIFALATATRIATSVNDGSLLLQNIEPFRSENIYLVYRDAQHAITKINSNYPVIVSCFEAITVQPISSEPLLIVPKQNDYVSVAISDCSSNELIQDFSLTQVTFKDYRTGKNCDYTEEEDPAETQVFKIQTNNCYFFVQPLENVCVSILAVDNLGSPYGVGLSESSFSKRFVINLRLDAVWLFSFSETTCTGFNYIKEEPDFPISLIFQDSSNKVSGPGNAESFDQYIWVDCDDPTLVTVQSNLIPFLSGYQSEEMWQPFFDSVCIVDPTVTPEEESPPPPDENPTPDTPIDAPSSSDALSLVSCSSLSWAALFLF